MLTRMMTVVFAALVAVPLLLTGTVSAVAQDASHCTDDQLVVGYHSFPGVFQEDTITGAPEGLAVDILSELRVQLGKDICYVDYPVFGSIFNEGGVNDVDIMAGALTINADREAMYDFSQPFMNAGVGIMVPASGEAGVATIAAAIFTPVVGQSILLFMGFLVVAGFALYIAERGNNDGIPDDFRNGWLEGIYCAFDTATTVGYGRVEPRKKIGRLLVAPIVFVAGALFVGTLVGSVSSALTVASLESSISSPADLRGRVVATKAGTSNVALLQRLGAQVLEVPSREATVATLRDGRAEAVVYDAPYLQFEAANDENLMVSATFSPQHYGFAMPAGSELREPLNNVLLQMWGDGSIDRITQQYFGE